jgi:hypothetical protein
MVMACPLLGLAIAFLVMLAVAVLDRWVSGAREAAPRPAPELVQSEPVVAAPLVVADTSRMRTAWAALDCGRDEQVRRADASEPGGGISASASIALAA